MYLLLFGLAIALAGSALWAFNTILEFEKPAIVLKDDLSTIGPGKVHRRDRLRSEERDPERLRHDQPGRQGSGCSVRKLRRGDEGNRR